MHKGAGEGEKGQKSAYALSQHMPLSSSCLRQRHYEPVEGGHF